MSWEEPGENSDTTQLASATSKKQDATSGELSGGAKRECWNRFLQEGKGNDVWTATQYMTPRIDKAGRSLVDEDGNIAEGCYE